MQTVPSNATMDPPAPSPEDLAGEAGIETGAGQATGAGPKRAQAGSRAIVQTIGARIAMQALNAATGIMTARTLLPEGRGQLAAMTLWSLFLAGATTFGIPSSIIFFLRSRPDRRGELIMSAFVMSSALGVLTGIVGVFFMPHWLHQYPAWLVRDAQWFLIVTPICSLTFLGRSILESQSNFSSSNFSQILSPLVTLVLLVGLLLTHHLTVLTAALAYVAAILPVAGFMIHRVRPLLSDLSQPTLAGAKLLLSYGIRSYAVDLLGTLSLQVDQVLVVSLLASADMGLYAVMLSLSRMANVFQNAVSAVLFPKASGQTPARIIELTGRAARVSFAITATVTFLIGLLGPFLLKLFYGKDYTSASGCLRVLLAEVTLTGLVFILAQAYMALDHPGTVSVLQAIGLSISVPLMFLLIPRYGITGAALALLISTSARLVLILLGFRFYLKQPVPSLALRWHDFQALLPASLRR